MAFNKIDIKSWERADAFKHYSTDVPCTYSMCVNLDITKLLKQIKGKKLKIFPVILYGISYIVNRHSEFRMAKDSNGNIGWYDKTNPCFTVFHDKTEKISEVWTEYEENFELFYNSYLSDMKTYGNERADVSKPANGNNLFNVSCIPWVSFTGFNLNLQNGYDFFPPIFTIGKYFSENEKVVLPLSIQVHHAVCDGFHLARFINELQDWANEFI
ncbi:MULTISPECIES: type A chloramphenicol O-acetyltransferase [unclassified Sedimentibacter]|uniref:type A chloramphenicol O-acetyltransferase n=1 Tax=unclassified Sedimentibacter TaxID=2649220 RepID=UPI0027E0C707|nr:type A chloramphenicol O-acetyltransferase [Sedimentibacter sp. MB35-C1]WMJ77082.1 type A chloramphenicol O-acetyltransferase [Sedimentibacter sp. MB35-C1]